MTMDEIKKIVSVDTSAATSAIKKLKSEIDALRSKLDQLAQTSSQYATIQSQLTSKINEMISLLKAYKSEIDNMKSTLQENANLSAQLTEQQNAAANSIKDYTAEVEALNAKQAELNNTVVTNTNVTNEVVDTNDKVVKTLKDYKSEIDALKAQLIEMDSTSEQYANIAQEVRERQEKLNQVMKIGKQNGEALEGSYNHLVEQMKVLRTEWRATTDEANREALGKQINSINNELKELDASTGNFSRNVGNYEAAFQSAFTKSLEGITGLKGPLKDVSTMFANMIPMFRNLQATGVGTFTAIKGAIASTGIGLFAVAIGQVIQLLGDLWQKTKDEADAVEQAMKDAHAAYEEGYKKIHDLKHEQQSENVKMAFEEGKQIVNIAEETNKLLENAEKVHQEKMQEITVQYGGLDHTHQELNAKLVEEEQRFQNEKLRIRQEALKLQLGVQQQYDDKFAEQDIASIKKDLDRRIRADKSRTELLKAQARQQIKDQTKLQEKLYELDMAHYNKSLNLQQAYINQLRKNFNTTIPGVQQAIDDAILDLQGTEATKLNFETNAEETANRIKSSLTSAKTAVDKYAEDYKRAAEKIDLEKKEKLFITDRDVADEKERTLKMNQVKLDAIEKQIKLEEEYKNHYLKDADKQIEVDKRLIDLYQQQLGLMRDQADARQKIVDAANNQLMTELNNELAKKDETATQQKFEVDTDAEIENEQVKANAKYEIEKNLTEQKIALLNEYLEKVQGNAELEAQIKDQIAKLEQKNANDKRKLEYDQTKMVKQQAEQQRKDKEAAAKAGAAAVAGILGGLSDLMEEGSKEAKALALMEATVNTAAGAVAAYKAGVSTITVPAWAGAALGATMAAATIVQGMAQIKAIKATNKDNAESTSGQISSSMSAVGVTPLLDENADLERLQNLSISPDSETQRDTRVYVLESDIRDMQHKVDVRDGDATF